MLNINPDSTNVILGDKSMLLAGEESIREIIAFPMNKNAQDIMMDAPSEVEPGQLDELHIAIVKQEEDKSE